MPMMQAGTWLTITLGAAAAILSREAPGRVPTPRDRDGPTSIIIMADDDRHDAASFMGHPYLETPNLERMSRAGVAFANALVTTSLCSSSRASILTGRYAPRHGVIDNDTPVPPTL
jgi:N-acetylglucosamine-6-sulfatase